MPSAMGGGSFEPKVITSGALGGQNMVPPPPTPALAVPRIIPVEPLPGRGQVVGSARPKLIQLQRDTTGLVPARPPGPTLRRPNSEVAKDVDRMLILPIREPEGEIAIVAGQSRIVQTKKTLTQVVMANPTIADVELLANRPEGHVLNVSGKSYGDTTMTLWDEDNQPVSFLIRVSMDTKDLESRINQAFPGAQVKVRQVGLQLILDGQVPDSKTMSDVTQLVMVTVRMSPFCDRRAVGAEPWAVWVVVE